MAEPLLIDLGGCCPAHTDHALEDLFKAMAENPDGDERSIWSPHDNPVLAAHVEDVTMRLSAILQRIQDALATLLFGKPLGTLAKADMPWLRWSPEDFARVRAMVETRDPSTFSLDDWMEVVSFIIQTYLPDGVIATEAEYMTVRPAMLGRLQAAAGNQPIPPDMMAMWATLTPTTFAAVPPRVLSTVELETLNYAKAAAAIHVSAITEKARLRLREIVLEHVQAGVIGQKEGTNKHLETRLRDEFGQLNRDFRRIAVTESGEAANQAFVASRPIGSKVKRVEAYKGACKFCRSLNGRVFAVVDPADPKRNGETDVWVGKTNAGRSASPMMRVGSVLMERAADEQFWCASGVQHPHCRGRWLPVEDAPENISPAFAAMMRDMIAKHRLETDGPGANAPPS